MKLFWKSAWVLVCVFVFLIAITSGPPAADAAKAKATVKAEPVSEMGKPNDVFNAEKMADMSEYDPATVVQPTGDTIKIAIVASFSGAGAMTGHLYWQAVNWVAYDLNKRGGLFVDGKKKLIQVLKADHMGKADQCKKICERMALQEKVDVFWGTNGSHLMRIINEVASKYKIIALNVASVEDTLMDATNFNRYAFLVNFSTEQIGRSLAYYYGQIRKKEKKFYILNQDYGFGHALGEDFKKGLREYYPTAQIVGEDYHKLYLTDFAPYIEKVKASGAEVIVTGDWVPDAGNLLKQARQMGLKLPFANFYMSEPTMLHEVGVEGTKGLVNLNPWYSSPQFKSPGHIKFYRAWNNQWKNNWKTIPYNSHTFEHFGYIWGSWTGATYWFFSVMERAKTTNPEKIISLFENDTYQFVNGQVVRMRACDHKMIQDLAVVEFVPPEEQKVSMNIPPYYWYKGCSSYGPAVTIPASKVLPWMDQKLDRCKGKNRWGK